MDTSKNFKRDISYQENSVVSREIINKPAGTVTLFAFGRGQGLTEHRTPFDAVITVTDGQAEITVDGITNNIVAGETIFIPANSIHKLKAVIPFKMNLTMIKT